MIEHLGRVIFLASIVLQLTTHLGFSQSAAGPRGGPVVTSYVGPDQTSFRAGSPNGAFRPNVPGQSIPQSPAPQASGASPVTAAYVADQPAGVVRLPATVAVAPAPNGPAPGGTAADGTWREEGQFVIINMNGKETRLLKPASQASAPAMVAPPRTDATVRGRLLHNRQPLANCHVVMVRMKEEGGRISGYETTQQPLTATTDSDGEYIFENVPPGMYKLTWLPQGTRQWIRRLAQRPDVVAQAGQDVVVKDVKAALGTIN